MIITTISGNVHSHPEQVQGMEIVEIPMDNGELRKRVQRLQAADGTEIGLRLPAGHDHLHDGDIVLSDASSQRAYIIRTTSTDVLVIRPGDIHSMGVVAHTLGNRHMPAQFEGEAMLVQYDHTVEDWLRAHTVPYTREDRVLAEPFRHAEHSH